MTPLYILPKDFKPGDLVFPYGIKAYRINKMHHESIEMVEYDCLRKTEASMEVSPGWFSPIHFMVAREGEDAVV